MPVEKAAFRYEIHALLHLPELPFFPGRLPDLLLFFLFRGPEFLSGFYIIFSFVFEKGVIE